MLNIPDLGPELDSFIREDGSVSKVYGGIRRVSGQDTGYFLLAWSLEPTEGLVGFGTAKSSGVEDFPEFDDLALLMGCDHRGEPVGAEREGWRLLALPYSGTGASFSAEALGKLFRIAPVEAEHVRYEILAEIDRIADATGVEHEEAADVVRAGFYADWLEAQRPRWQADADSAIEAHDLTEYVV